MSTHEFDPYGVPLTEPTGDPYGYTGEWWQADIGLLHLRARWYDPQSGTFLSRDAVESEPPYQYVRGNPILYSDPTGHYFEVKCPHCDADLIDVSDWSYQAIMITLSACTLTIGCRYDISRGMIVGPTREEFTEMQTSSLTDAAFPGAVIGKQIGGRMGRSLTSFVEARLGSAPQNINCYGCVLKEWFEYLGKSAALDDLTPNPWGHTFDAQCNFAQYGTDLIEFALNDNATITNRVDELIPGDIVSWTKDIRGFFVPGMGATTHSHISHVGIYLGEGKIFSKLGSQGEYTIKTINELSEMYGIPRFWKLLEE